MEKLSPVVRRFVIFALLAAALLAGGWLWRPWQADGPGAGFASGNGRIEATEIDIATRFGGRVEEILVREGEFVKAGQVLARMQIDTLRAQHREALAAEQESRYAIAAAKALVAQRRSDVAAQRAVVVQREAELERAQRRFERTRALAEKGSVSRQQLDDDRAGTRSARAGVEAARAQVVALAAAVEAALAQQVGAEARLVAVQASVARIVVDIDDSELKAPRAGRVQFRVAQPGEVLGAGGRLMNLLDLSDVYMTFFLPEVEAGRLALGSEARIVLDAMPQYPIPASISFVASAAQFTPKTVETASERQKLMFRVRARIAPELLQDYLEHVKTGLPGVTWVKLDSSAEWPSSLKAVRPG